jgi:quercetin dioxygenase-like cupin family protein
MSPHWGYLLDGEILMKYDDGTEEILLPGDVFYMQPGHTAIVKKDMKIIDFSPEKELNEVMTHIAKRMAELSQ